MKTFILKIRGLKNGCLIKFKGYFFLDDRLLQFGLTGLFTPTKQ
jgi:hypothetical protein